MAEIQAIAFDKDGTLFDSERLYAESLITACDELGYEVTESQCAQFYGLAAESTFALLETFIGADFDRDKMIKTWFAHRDKLIEQGGIVMIAGAEKAVRACVDQGYPIALVTSDDYDGVLHDFAHAPEDFLELFSVMVTVDDVAQAKPDPDPYLRAAAYLGVAPKNLLVVEDSVHGAESALAAGCVLAVHPSTEMPEHITKQAAKILQSIDEIMELL